MSRISDNDSVDRGDEVRGHTRRRRLAVLVVIIVVVVVAVVALTTYLRSPQQRLERAANDLNGLPGVASAQVDDDEPSHASPDTVDPGFEQVLVKLRPRATRAQVVDLIARAAAATDGTAHVRVFYIETGRATTCVCDDTTNRAATVAAELLALRRVSSGRAYVYDNASVGLDPPEDRTGTEALEMSREALGLLQSAGLAMPRRFKTYDGTIRLVYAVGTAAELSAVLRCSRTQLDDDWQVRWLSGRRLSFTVPPGVGLAATTAQVRRIAESLAAVGPPGRPIVARVVASSADRSAYADVAVD